MTSLSSIVERSEREEGQSAPSPLPRARPNRVAVIGIIAVASAIALLPYFLFVDRLAWWLAIAPVAAGVASFALRKETAEAATQPSLGEWLLAAWSAVAKPAIGSLIGLMSYGILYYLVKLLIAPILLVFGAALNPSTWGFWGSIWLAFAGGLVGATEGAQVLFRQLYPREAGARSAFFPLLARWKLLLIGAMAGVVAVAVMFWLLDPHGVALPVLLSAVLFYTGFPLAEAGEEAADKAQVKIIDALAPLLQEGGYRIVRAPRTGKAEIDPLLTSVDVLAQGDDRAFAVQVKSVASRAPVEWNEASAVRTAATLLSEEVRSDGGAPVPVEPLLMLVGGTVAQSLQAFSQRERVLLVHFEHAADAIGNPEELKRRLQAAGLALRRVQATSSVPA